MSFLFFQRFWLWNQNWDKNFTNTKDNKDKNREIRIRLKVMIFFKDHYVFGTKAVFLNIRLFLCNTGQKFVKDH